MGAWLAQTFPAIGNQVNVYQGSQGVVGFDPTDPTGLFTSITTTPPTYAELSALSCASEGWQKIFDQWKANGVVS